MKKIKKRQMREKRPEKEWGRGMEGKREQEDKQREGLIITRIN